MMYCIHFILANKSCFCVVNEVQLINCVNQNKDKSDDQKFILWIQELTGLYYFVLLLFI